MPELPEVETTVRGIEPALRGRQIASLVVREHRLRWPVSDSLASELKGRRILSLGRRAKYIMIRLDRGYLVCHLGMSGSMRIVNSDLPVLKHDHFDLVLTNGIVLRYNDPRRFGCLFLTELPDLHPLISRLGPEPLGDDFNGARLYNCSRGRRIAVKAFIMDQKIVVGVGNIYASEALFKAGILPARQAGRISRQRYNKLAWHIKQVLSAAIEQGGTTLRDFVQADGRPGYFKQKLAVYDRQFRPCPVCGQAILNRVIGQRASYYCPACQR